MRIVLMARLGSRHFQVLFASAVLCSAWSGSRPLRHNRTFRATLESGAISAPILAFVDLKQTHPSKYPLDADRGLDNLPGGKKEAPFVKNKR